MADRFGADSWLRGPYGPQFFPIALYTAVFYAAIGAAMGGMVNNRPRTALAGFMAPFIAIVLFMTVLTRYSGWGMPQGMPSTPQWQLFVTVLYSCAIWGTIIILGAGCSLTGPWRGAFVSALGAAAAYGLLILFLWAVPSYAKAHWSPISFLPSPINLMDGLLSGAVVCLALSLDAKVSGGTTHGS